MQSVIFISLYNYAQRSVGLRHETPTKYFKVCACIATKYGEQKKIEAILFHGSINIVNKRSDRRRQGSESSATDLRARD